MTRTIILSTTACIAIATGAAVLANVNDTMPDHAAGYMTTQIEVAHRDAPIDVHIWYPTLDRETPTMIAQNILFNGFAAQQDATPATRAAPVVIFSHGSGGKAVQTGWLASQLATQGMIVVAPNHLGTMSQDSDPFQTSVIWRRTQDLSATLDALEDGALGAFAPDMERVSSMGFSLGGGTALTLAGARLSKSNFIAYCAEPEGTPDCDWMEAGGVDFTQIDQTLYEGDWSDPRISNVIAIDPALTQAMTQGSLSAMTLPTLTLGLGNAETVPIAADAYHLQDRILEAQHLWVPQSAHFSFLPSCGMIGKVATSLMGDDNICSDWGLRDRDEVHEEISTQISAFLEQGFHVPS